MNECCLLCGECLCGEAGQGARAALGPRSAETRTFKGKGQSLLCFILHDRRETKPQLKQARH